jgi:CDP-glucose 4,6-dehydratase
VEFRPGALESLGVNSSFWRGKRVLLTGHTGFKGAWMTLWLGRLGAKVTGYALAAPTSPSLFELAGLEKRAEHIQADIRDLPALQRAFSQAQPEIAIHMAAQSLVRRSYADPAETFATNVMGTANFLEALRSQGGVRAALVVTSDKCYQSRDGAEGYREGDPLGGSDPYSSSKACAELVTASYRKSFFLGQEARLAVASARAGNVVGGGDWAEDRLVPDILRALAKGESPQIRNPASVRPWQHVLEPLSGYLLLAERLWEEGASVAEAWNFGPGREDEKPVRFLAERLCGLWGLGQGWKDQAGLHPAEAPVLRLDSSKARARLGWRPRWSLEQSLDAIVAWQRQYLAGADMQKFSLSQIGEYERA